MSKPPISRFPVPEITDLPEDIRSRILTVQEKSGFVPNVFLVLARRPDVVAAARQAAAASANTDVAQAARWAVAAVAFREGGGHMPDREQKMKPGFM